jgi:glycosyltransferase involved in cell wall biosynthesis
MQRKSAKNFPAVTVLIPAYNIEGYIAAAVRSAALQDYAGELAIIVLDDGSSDGTLRKLKQLQSELPTLQVYSQPNAGRAEARNRLLTLAKTEFVAWLDGDDMASPTWVREQLTPLLTDQELVAVSGQGYALTASARPIGPIVHPLLSGDIEERHLSGKANAFFQSTVVVRKSSVLAAGGYRTEYPVAEDFDLWLRLSEVGRLMNVDALHLYYRVHETSANSTLSVHQRQQGTRVLNEARRGRGLPELADPMGQADTERHDWGRRVYWINIALRSGNPLAALELLAAAIPRHPASLLLWAFAVAALTDTVLFAGNRSSGFAPGQIARIKTLPFCSAYRLGRSLVRLRRRVLRAVTSS